MMNFKPTLIVLLSVFVIAELIAETESILFGKTIQSENEKKEVRSVKDFLSPRYKPMAEENKID